MKYAVYYPNDPEYKGCGGWLKIDQKGETTIVHKLDQATLFKQEKNAEKVAKEIRFKAKSGGVVKKIGLTEKIKVVRKRHII